MVKHSVTCVWGCDTTWTIPRKPPADGLGCGKGECARKHAAAVVAYQEARAEQAKARTKARAVAPKPAPMYGDWGMVCLLANGGVKKGQR